MLTAKLLPQAELFVPEAEADAYRQHNPGLAILTHPSDLRGKSGKLNWFFANQPEPDVLLSVDDDIDGITRCWLEPGETGATVKDPEHALAILAHTAQLAVDCGAKLFGFAPSARHNTMHKVYLPFSLKGYVNGTCYGFVRGHGLRFDKRLTAKNDYDVSCQAIYRHRYVFRNERYAMKTVDMFGAKGGSTKYRNSVTEAADIALLQRKWGDVVRVAGQQRGSGQMIVRDRAGTRNIELHFPL